MPETTTEEAPTIEELVGSLLTRVADLENANAYLQEAVLELTEAKPAPAVLTTLEPHPSPGRIVTYHTGVQTFPAIVTHVYRSGAVALVVFGMGAPATIRDSVLEADEDRVRANRWTWPARPEPAGAGGEQSDG